MLSIVLITLAALVLIYFVCIAGHYHRRYYELRNIHLAKMEDLARAQCALIDEQLFSGRCKTELLKARAERDCFNRRAKDLSVSLDLTTKRADSNRGMVDILRGSVKRLRTERDDFSRRLSRSEVDHDKTAKELISLREALATEKTRCAVVRAWWSDVSQEVTRLEKVIEGRDAEIQRLNKNFEKLSAECEDLRAKLDGANGRCKILLAEYQAVQASRDGLREANLKLMQRRNKKAAK